MNHSLCGSRLCGEFVKNWRAKESVGVILPLSIGNVRFTFLAVYLGPSQLPYTTHTIYKLCVLTMNFFAILLAGLVGRTPSRIHGLP